MARVGLTAERLTQAGAELADEVGFDQVTVSELARRFDVLPVPGIHGIFRAPHGRKGILGAKANMNLSSLDDGSETFNARRSRIYLEAPAFFRCGERFAGRV